jgi:hypothetical protein
LHTLLALLKVFTQALTYILNIETTLDFTLTFFFRFTAVGKEKGTQVESNETAHVASPAALHLNSSTEAGGGSTSQTTIDAQNSNAVASQLIRSSSSRPMENAQDSGERK